MTGSLLMYAQNCHGMSCLGIGHVSLRLGGMACYACRRCCVVRCCFCVVLSNRLLGAHRHVFLHARPERARLARNTEPVGSRQLAKTDRMRTQIIGVPCATHGTHLHMDTVMCAEVADSPCDVNGGESDVLLYISKDVLTCNLMSSEGAACPQMVETAGIHHIHHVERAGA
jgi:hypothetical protein